MQTSYLADRIGDVDHTGRTFDESLYLLDSSYRVIGMRRATGATGPVPKCGDLLFTHYPIASKDKACFDSACSLLNPCPLLFRAGNRPMLALFEFYLRTHMILIAVPERHLRKHFDRPATHAAPTEWLHAYEILLSPTMFSRHAPITTESYNAMHTWLVDLLSPFHFGVDERECDYLVASIAVRLSLQAKLCGLHLSLDLTELSHDLRDTHELALVLPHSLAVMMAAVRLSKNRSLRIQANDTVGIGPTLIADFHTDEPPERIPELEPVRARSILRGDTFEYAVMPDDPCHVGVQYSLRPARISAQGVKNPFLFGNVSPASIWGPYYISGENKSSSFSIPDLNEDFPIFKIKSPE